MSVNSFQARRGAAIWVLGATLMLAACADTAGKPVTGSFASEPAPATVSIDSGASREITSLAAAHKANSTDPATAIAYARALRLSGSKAEGLAVLDKAAAAAPRNRQLQLQRGLLALDLGETDKAEKLLRLADDGREWRVHSALGTALAIGGKQQEARAQFAKALALAPDNPTVLNNLALSYALDGKGDDAEKLLRKAQHTAPKTAPVQQNLALVLGLRGKYDEAKSVAAVTLAPAKAGENVAFLQRLSAASSDGRRTGRPAAGTIEPAARNASASLPRPVYELGGPPTGN